MNESRDTAGFVLHNHWVPRCGMREPVQDPGGEGAGPGEVEWLIVGGGVHGTYLSHYLLHRIGILRERLAVIDPYDAPLARWRQMTGNIGMRVLRSPATHHIDVHSLSLKRFARRVDSAPTSVDDSSPLLNEPYDRPALRLWNAHADHVVAEAGLSGVRRQGRVLGLSRQGSTYRVAYTGGEVVARRVLLAIGASEEPQCPSWANALRQHGKTVMHVFDPRYRLPEQLPAGIISVVGAGLSGAQLAVHLSRRARGRVELVGRRRPAVHLFDSDREWQGRNRMAGFAMLSSPEERRAVLQRERHRGSVTPEAAADLEAAEARGDLRITVSPEPEAAVRGNTVYLTTGFRPERPGGAWIEEAVKALSLPTASDGYPVVDTCCAWAPGLYVSGPLAELELGPVSRNISGAHRMAARLRVLVYGHLPG